MPAPARSATAFDALFAQLNGPASLDMTTSTWDRALERLSALAPVGDARRDIQLRSVDCSHSRWGTSPALVAYIDAARRAAVDAHDVGSQARLAICQAAFEDLGGHGQAAITTLGTALALAEDARDPLLTMQVLSYRGDLHSLLGNQAVALLDYDHARQVLQRAGLQSLARQLLTGTGMIYRRMGEYARALQQFQQLEVLLPPDASWEDHYGIAMQKGFLYTEGDKPALGLQAFAQALAMARAQGTASDRAAALAGLAQAQVGHGDFTAALASIDAAQALPGARLNDTDRGVNQLVEGQALSGLRRHREALVHLDKALALLRGESNPRYLSWLYETRSLTEEALGDTASALADYRRHAVLQRSLDDLASHQQGLLIQLEASARQGELENRQLRQQQAFQQQRVDALLRVRRWQSAALVLGLLLLGSLAILSATLLRRTRQLRRIAMVDSLTQLANRRSIYAAAHEAVAVARLSGKPLSVLAVDIDRFKSINDRHGHPAGDAVLVAVAERCKVTLRQGDLIGRAGGEEFLVLCPDTDLAAACGIAERLLQAVRTLDFVGLQPPLQVTISIGAASLRNASDTIDTLIAQADRALYVAKENGRDRWMTDAGTADPGTWTPAPGVVIDAHPA
ncbi:GGDEF domain-containing protein [Cognatiluteimonas profundi]|uniref:GGDEF domain-containing protein n=1 Tax=Cognatiluteimonas profundi TaxID=2594501 RepID=UPI00131D7CE0|nr:GGDEF domain-containing protein [Lysobacter profundi]